MHILQELVDTLTLNKIKILFAIKEKNDCISIDELSKKTGFERRTIETYINDLTHDYIQFNTTNSNLQFTISTDKRISIRYQLYEDFYSFILFLVSQSFSIRLLSRLFLGEVVSTTEYISEHFISSSTLKRRIAKIRPVLKRYKIELITKKGNLFLNGDEQQIRILAYTFFWMLCKGKYWPFQIEKQKVIDIQAELSQNFNRRLSQTNIEQKYFVLAINILRFRRGHKICFSEDWLKQFFPEQFILLSSHWEQHHLLSKNEFFFYVLVLQSQEKFYLEDELGAPTLAFHKESNSLIYQSTEAFFNTFSAEICPIPPAIKKEYFSYIFAYHLFCTLFTNVPFGMSGFGDSESVKNRFPLLESRLANLLKQLYRTTKIDLFKEESFLLPRYALFFSSIKAITYFEKPFSIYIDTDLPLISENRLINKLLEYFKDSYNIEVSSTMEFFQESTFDLILTTSFTPVIKTATTTDSILFITEELRLEDIIRIDTSLAALRANRT